MRVPDNEIVDTFFHEPKQVHFSCFCVDVLRRFVKTVTPRQCFWKKTFEKGEKTFASLTYKQGVLQEPPGEAQECSHLSGSLRADEAKA